MEFAPEAKMPQQWWPPSLHGKAVYSLTDDCQDATEGLRSTIPTSGIPRSPRPRLDAILPRRPAAARLAVTAGLAAIPVCAGLWVGTDTWAGVAITAAASLALGFLLSLMLPIMHEATHGSIARARVTNALIGWLAGAILLIDFATYRRLHLAHHRHTGEPKDPEAPVELKSTAGYLLHLTPYYFLIPFWRLSWAWMLSTPRGLSASQAALVALTVGIAGATALWPVHALWIYWAPLMLSAGFLFLTTVHEHVPLQGDAVPVTRTIVSNPLLSFLLWNTNLHIEHHRSPTVPFDQLRVHDASPQPLPGDVVSGFAAFHRRLLAELRRSPRAEQATAP